MVLVKSVSRHSVEAKRGSCSSSGVYADTAVVVDVGRDRELDETSGTEIRCRVCVRVLPKSGSDRLRLEASDGRTDSKRGGFLLPPLALVLVGA